MASQRDQPDQLEPSALGTKEYWDSTYTKELANFAENPEDKGTIWFSESDAESKVRAYLCSLAGDGTLLKRKLDDRDPTSFLDVGTGNGHMLLALRESGWEGKMVGVDYSATSVHLAERLQYTWKAGEADLDISEEDDDDITQEDQERGSSRTKADDVLFRQVDILEDDSDEWLGEGFDVVLDKGTFDAISLNAGENSQGQRASDSYQARIQRMIKPGGLLVVVSCNWTEDELRKWLLKDEMVDFGKIDYPSFTFGGRKGQQICTLCFQRRKQHQV